MINKIFLAISLVSLLLYLYGILTSVINVEENSCKMTYMFEYPQFVKINFRENDDFPKYNLYAYSEGHLTENARNMYFNGAPVLFIPGNGGSYKQARSLASVALRKGVDNDWIQHLDYFTVDLNGEYSGLFGGVLEEQTQFIVHCIRKILELYKKLPNPPKSLVIVGHSMGGKIAQSLVGRPEIMDSINTIITLAAPMDKPVVAFDYYTEKFYKNTEKYWLQHRSNVKSVTNTTNNCKPYKMKIEATNETDARRLDEKLLVTIGGGSRDLLVHPGLTSSKFSDIHVMTTKIPNVWLTTDHKSSVWCLQLVMNINRFLYSIIVPFTSKKQHYKGQGFVEDKNFRLNKAKWFFDPQKEITTPKEVQLVTDKSNIGDWVEDSRRVFSEYFAKGIERNRFQMIRLIDNPLHKFVRIETINMETSDWIFGCVANEIDGMKRYCSKGVSLTQYVTTFPSTKNRRMIFMMDLHKIKMKNHLWTHLVIRMTKTNEAFKVIVDVHDPGDRTLTISMPKWYSFGMEKLLDDTLMGSSIYYLKIKGMDETHETIELNVKPRSCSKENHQAVAKICVPWTDGFERFTYFTDSKTSPMYLYVPTSKPIGYNTSKIPVNVDLHLDPACRYKITYRNSFSQTLGRIVQQFSQWIPAHLAAILFLVLKHQITVTPKDANFKCGNFYAAIIKCSPFFIITASRVFVKLVLFFKFLPPPDAYEYSLFVSILIHGTAMAVLCVATGVAWAGICFFGNTAHKILFKLIHLPIPTLSSTVTSIIEKFPMSVAIFLISLSMASCGAVGLLLATLVYFVIITKMYEDYLEEFVFKTAKLIAEKLFGKRRRPAPENAEEDTPQPEATDEPNIETPLDAQVVARRPNGDASIEDEDNETEGESDNDEALNRMLRESLDRYKEQEEKTRVEKLAERKEYDSILDGLSAINFHLSLCFLLLITTLLNLPTVITWARNYSFSPLLHPDPSIYPSCVTLASLAVIWQLPTPRDLRWYNYIGNIFYVLAVVSVIYCQESVWRLNYLIAFAFAVLAFHQIFAPKFKASTKIDFFKDPRFQIQEIEKLLEQPEKKKRKKKKPKTDEEPQPSTSKTDEAEILEENNENPEEKNSN